MTPLSISARLSFYSGWGGVLFGCLVLVGWWTDVEALRSLLLEAGEVRPNSGLLFVLLGAALVYLPEPGLKGGTRRTWLLLGGALLVSLLTLLEYAVGRDLGVDASMATGPGGDLGGTRMSDKCAIGFLLVAVAIASLHTPTRSNWRPMFAGLLSSLVGSLAAFSVAGWFLQLPTSFPLEDVGPMPLPSALGQAGLAVGVMALAHARSRLIGDAEVRWVPLGVAIGVVTLSCMLWLGIRLEERRQIRSMIYRATVNVERLVANEIQARILTLVRVAKRWEQRREQNREEWDFDAGLYLSHYPDMRAVAWVAGDGRPRWSAPQNDDEAVAALGSMIARAGGGRGAPTGLGGVHVSRVIELDDRRKGFLVLVPAKGGAASGGTVVGVFRVEPLLRGLLTEVTAGFHCDFYEGRERILSTAHGPVQEEEAWSREGLVRLPGRSWQLRLWPRHDTLHELRSPLGTAALGGGCVLAVLLGLSIHLAQESRQKERNAVAANRSLGDEVKERRQIQEALRESQQRLQAIMDNTQAVIYLKDAQGRHLLINRQFEKLFHVKNDDLVGRSDYEVFPKQMAEAFRFNDQRVLTEGRPLVLEEIAPHDDGLHTYISVKFPIRNAAGKVSGVCGISTDITDRKQAEARLRDNHQALELARDRLQGILEGSPDRIIALDLRYRVLSFNSAFRRDFEGRFGKGLRVGGRLSDLGGSHPEELQRWFDLWLRAMRGEEFAIEEHRPREGRGDLFLEHRFSPIRSESGVLIGATQVTRDISERRRADDERNRLLMELARRNEQLIGANKELEAFSYTVSHDLRAPVRHIDGFVKLLERGSGDALDEKGRRYISLIADAAAKMGRLIDDLLSFSRMSRAELRMGEVAMEDLVTEVRADLAPETESREIEWVVGPLPRVQGDKALLRQVWMNLVANAVKYSRGRNPARIEIGCKPSESGEPAFFVRDNGVGFDMKYVDRLFGVFQRLHSEEEFEGTGIGLANVMRIVHRHGGRAWAEARLDHGAIFWFTLPASA